MTRGVEVMAGACTDGREARGLADPSGEELRAEAIPMLPAAAAHSSQRSLLAVLNHHTQRHSSKNQRFQTHRLQVKNIGYRVQGMAQLKTELAHGVTKQRISACRRHSAPGLRCVAKLSPGLASRWWGSADTLAVRSRDASGMAEGALPSMPS